MSKQGSCLVLALNYNELRAQKLYLLFKSYYNSDTDPHLCLQLTLIEPHFSILRLFDRQLKLTDLELEMKNQVRQCFYSKQQVKVSRLMSIYWTHVIKTKLLNFYDLNQAKEKITYIFWRNFHKRWSTRKSFFKDFAWFTRSLMNFKSIWQESPCTALTSHQSFRVPLFVGDLIVFRDDLSHLIGSNFTRLQLFDVLIKCFGWFRTGSSFRFWQLFLLYIPLFTAGLHMNLQTVCAIFASANKTRNRNRSLALLSPRRFKLYFHSCNF